MASELPPVMHPQNALVDLNPVISAKAIEKSGRVLKAVSLLYLPFHGLQPIELFEFYGPIAFISSAVYQSDELNERDDIVIAPTLKIIDEYLAQQNLLDGRILRYLKDGENYLSYERRYRKTTQLSLEEIFTAVRWRSFDFRILHCLLHRFLGKDYAEEVFEAYEAFEMLMEIDDDIGSYDDDLKAGTFNFLCALSLLRSIDARKVGEEFRSSVVRRIEESQRLLPSREAHKFVETLKMYSKLVPEPVIPIIGTTQQL